MIMNEKTDLDIDVEKFLDMMDELHPSDIADNLKKIKKQDKKLFYRLLHEIPEDYLGEVLLELPESLREKAYKSLSSSQITQAIEELETDDATDIIKDIEEIDEKKATEILESLDQEDQDDINWLKKYEDDEAGAYMQTELFKAKLSSTIKESIENLKQLKQNDEVENINQVFIVDDEDSLVASISLEDLITYDFDTTYEFIVKKRC